MYNSTDTLSYQLIGDAWTVCTDPSCSVYIPAVGWTYSSLNISQNFNIDGDVCVMLISPGLINLPCLAEGCTDPLAMNYDPNIVIDDSSCSYQMTYVPNDGFEMVIESLGLGDSLINDSVYTHLISQVNFLNISEPINHPINNLIGIEDFTSLTELYLQEISISSLSLDNQLLEDLYITDCSLLNSFSIDDLDNLYNLRIDNSGMDSIIISNKSTLENFDCDHNSNLTYLELSHLSNIQNISTIANGDTAQIIHYKLDNLTNPSFNGISFSILGGLTQLPEYNYKLSIDTCHFNDLNFDGAGSLNISEISLNNVRC